MSYHDEAIHTEEEEENRPMCERQDSAPLEHDGDENH